MLLYILNEGKINSYAMIKLICILKFQNNRRLKQYSSSSSRTLTKKINFVNVFMQTKFQPFKKFNKEAVADILPIKTRLERK